VRRNGPGYSVKGALLPTHSCPALSQVGRHWVNMAGPPRQGPQGGWYGEGPLTSPSTSLAQMQATSPEPILGVRGVILGSLAAPIRIASEGALPLPEGPGPC
jgi:hypothetical protein